MSCIIVGLLSPGLNLAKPTVKDIVSCEVPALNGYHRQAVENGRVCFNATGGAVEWQGYFVTQDGSLTPGDVSGVLVYYEYFSDKYSIPDGASIQIVCKPS